jgi:hypothetical protein
MLGRGLKCDPGSCELIALIAGHGVTS